ncbi:MAG: SRPBCC domain-containing protein [Acidobacteriia bacterium]|nr:SRPBCC domain-containing protein [Terriglobia bacterium]
MPDIDHTLQISAAPEAVYSLVATADGLRKWWAEDVSHGPETVDLGFFNRDTIYKLKLESSAAPSRAKWLVESGKEWSGTRLIFEITPAGQGCKLRFTHAGWAAATDYFVSCNTTWGGLMFRLKDAAEGRANGPLFTAAGMSY